MILGTWTKFLGMTGASPGFSTENPLKTAESGTFVQLSFPLKRPIIEEIMLKPVRSYLLRPLLVLAFVLPCLAADAQTDLVDPSWQNESQVKLIVTAWQQNFTLEDPLLVKVTLKNTSTEPETFIFAAESSFSVKFNIFDRDRNLLEKRPGVANLASADLISDLRAPRQITLCPDEEFTVKVDLNNAYAFRSDGRYLVQAVFNDSFNRRKVFSNPLWVNVRPNLAVATRLKTEETIRQREAETVMTPEGTVSYLLDAMRDKDWESFFKYVSLDKFVMLYSPWADAWHNADSDEVRQETLDNFKAWFKKVPEYNNLETYRIQNIVFPRDSHERVIHCYVKYNRNIQGINSYLYSFHLQQKGNKWYLYNMETVITKEKDWGNFDATKNPLGPTQRPQ